MGIQFFSEYSPVGRFILYDLWQPVRLGDDFDLDCLRSFGPTMVHFKEDDEGGTWNGSVRNFHSFESSTLKDHAHVPTLIQWKLSCGVLLANTNWLSNFWSIFYTTTVSAFVLFACKAGIRDSILLPPYLGIGTRCPDLTCNIIEVSHISAASWMLFWWEGTNAPPSSCSVKLFC